MTIPENTRRPPASPATGKPSLMGGSYQAAASGDGDATQPMRMLDAFDDAGPGRRAPAPNRVRLWLLAVSLTMLAVAAFSWWQQRNDAAMPTGPDVATRSTAATSEAPSATAEPDAPKASAVVDAASSAGPASIERSAELNLPAVLSRAQGKASSATARPKPATAPLSPAKVTTAGAAPRPAPARQAETPSAAHDPDVTLLSAMLARLSSDNGNDVAAQRATIAQLVERCEARSSGGSSEAVDCKRRICAGYWGKAEACPMALKKN